MTMMNVLLVDDHALFIEGLQNLLDARGIRVVGIAHNGYEALAQARILHPDVILMDINMPECDGLEATRLIKAEMPNVQIVMLTMNADDDNLFTAIKHGASGYLLKSLNSQNFFDYITGLTRGEAAMPRDLAARVLAEFNNQARQRANTAAPSIVEETVPDELTARQREVLELTAQGFSNKEIADTLVITERTVKYHMREILQKLHVRNRVQVVAYALQNGLVDSNMLIPAPRFS